MNELWMKFPEDILGGIHLSKAEAHAFESIFSSISGSPWSEALRRLRFKPTAPETRLVRWHRNTPYFNWSCMTHTVSGGAARPVKHENGYKILISYRFRDIQALLASHWKAERFIRENGPADFAESIALGLALQALILRLGSGAYLAKWLADPGKAPAKHRATLQKIHSVQMRRTQMSHIWQEAFPSAGRENPSANLPEFFWSDSVPADIPPPQTQPAEANLSGPWKGTAVCAGRLAGLAVAAPPMPGPAELAALKQKYNAPLILVFRRARPETVALFPHIGAALFCEGGALSHACTVAREMGLPSITALGPDLYEAVKAGGMIWLEADAASGTVTRIRSSG
jgi:phosphohistidine swiveling domain-containing protein